jgi:RimJ/RimL family protein N-acetyltransferase
MKEAESSLVLESERLRLRRLTTADGEFMLQLLNEPSFIANIGDRGVRTLEGARKYLEDGPIASYAKHGYGLYMVELKATGESLGICGLVKRDYLADADVGFAFLPEFWSRGYAFESAAAVKAFALETLGLDRVLAITSPGNAGSIRVLEKIGLKLVGMIRPPADAAEVRLFSSDT